MFRVRYFAVLMALASVAAGQTPSLQTVFDSVSATVDRIQTYRAESRIVQWFS